MSNADRIEELRSKYEENPRRYFAPLANEFRKAGDLAQAIAICREHLPKQPGHMSGYIVFGQTLFEANTLDEARTVFEQALALDPENLIALKHLGDIARIKGENSVARRWYERVLDADPRNEDIALQLASLTMPTPPLAMPAVPPNVPTAVPLQDDERNGVFRSFDPAALLEIPGDAMAGGVSRSQWEPRPVAQPRPVPTHEPIDLDFPDSPEPVAAQQEEQEFEEGLIAPQWPDTADLVQRVVTPFRSAAPVAVPITAETVAAFGREAHEQRDESAQDLLSADVHFDDSFVEPYLPGAQTAESRLSVEFETQDVPAAEWGHETNSEVELAHETNSQSEDSLTIPGVNVDQPNAAVTNLPVEPSDAASAAPAVVESITDIEHQQSAAEFASTPLEADQVLDAGPGTAGEYVEGFADYGYPNAAAQMLNESGVESQAGPPTAFENDASVASTNDEDVHIDAAPASLNVNESGELADPFPAAVAPDLSDAPVANKEVFNATDSWADCAPAESTLAPDNEARIHLGEPTANEQVSDEESFASIHPEVSDALFSESVEAFDEVRAPAANETVPDLSHFAPSIESSFAAAALDHGTASDSAAHGSWAAQSDTVDGKSSSGVDARDETVIETADETMEALAEGAGDDRDSELLVAAATAENVQEENRVVLEEADAQPEPPPVPEEPASAFVTETMAELLVKQGFIARAIDIYEELVRRRRYDPVLSSRLAELQSTEFQTAQASAVTPSRPTPLYNTPLQSTAAATPAVADQVRTTSQVDATPRTFRTAREKFALLAARRVSRRTPTHATAIPDDSAEGLSSLFGSALPTTPDELAARALADAFGPVQDSGESLFDPPANSTPSVPLRALTPRMNTSIPAGAAVGAGEPRAERAAASDYSFDRFFPDPAVTPKAPQNKSTFQSVALPTEPANEDLAQFSAWLKGLNNA